MILTDRAKRIISCGVVAFSVFGFCSRTNTDSNRDMIAGLNRAVIA